MNWTDYIPMCDVVVNLMHPLIEIVIHDIGADKIVYINGDLSERKVGGPSLLDNQSLKDIEQVIYPKINFNGRLIKSTSMVINNQWLLCINCDISVFSKMQSLSDTILKNIGTKPKSLFSNDWQEKLHIAIDGYLQTHNLSFKNLLSVHKKALIEYLLEVGAFNEKKAADYIAKILDISRASVFKCLKEARKDNNA